MSRYDDFNQSRSSRNQSEDDSNGLDFGFWDDDDDDATSSGEPMTPGEKKVAIIGTAAVTLLSIASLLFLK